MQRIIKHLRDVEKLTQEQIGEVIEWSRKQVADYNRILESIVPTNLELAKNNQTGRGTTDVPIGTLNFTEGWFREIVGLNEFNQKTIIEEYIKTEGKLKGGALKDKAKKYKMYGSFA